MRQISSKSDLWLNVPVWKALTLSGLSMLCFSIDRADAQIIQPEDLRFAEQSFKPEDSSPHPIKTIAGGPRFTPSRDNPYPEETESSGVRNDALCSQDQTASSTDIISPHQSMRAVVPDNGLKLTASGRPTFWITLPSTEARQVILSIEKINPSNHSKTFHAQKSYTIEQTPALIGLPMPEDALELEVESFYQWSVILVCGDNPHPSDPFVFATTQRMTPASFASEAQPIQQSTALSQAGFWYEPLSLLLLAHKKNPQDSALVQSWQSLMESAGLEAITQQYGPTKSAIHILSGH